MLIQGGLDLTGRSSPTGTSLAGAIAVAAGIALLIGLLTPIAATVVGVAATAMWFSILVGVMNRNLFTSKVSVGFLAAVAIAVACLGPGAFSIDARLFGLREIVIPPSRGSDR